MNTPFSEIAEVLASHKNIAIFGHERPDGDAIGAVMGLHHLIQINTQAQSTPYILDILPPELMFLPGARDYLKNELTTTDYDLLVVVDTANRERSGLSEEYIQDKDILVIDHHATNELYGDWNHIDPHACSVTEVLTDFIQGVDWEVTPEAATCLLTGIYTDTAGYIHRNVTQRTFEASAFLVSQGADNAMIAESVFKSNSFEFQKTLGTLLSRMCMYGDVNFCSMRGYEEASGKFLKTTLVGMLNSIQGVRYACVVTQDGDLVRASLRTNRPDLDVAAMAAVYGGGGHTKAAGLYFPAQLVRTDEGEDYIVRDGTKMTIPEFLKSLEV